MTLIIRKDTLNQLLKYQKSKSEIGGNFIYKDGILTIKQPIYKGDRFHVVFDQSVSPFNFHTHPDEPNILYSFYSQGDIVVSFKRQTKTNKIRKDFLVTEDGIYSLQLSPKALDFWRRYPYQAEILFGFYQRYVIEHKMNPKGNVPKDPSQKLEYLCNIKDMINLMNKATGQKVADWMLKELSENRLSFRDQNELARFMNLPLKHLGRLYFVNFHPAQNKNDFKDRFEFV